jgi:hypothetical protein
MHAIGALIVVCVDGTLAVLIGRDAARGGRNGWAWGAGFFVLPWAVGWTYLILRYRDSAAAYPALTAEQGSTVSVYRLYRHWRLQVIATCVVFTGVAIAMLVVAAMGKRGPGWAFTLFWIAAAAYMSYWFLFRVAYELLLTEDRLLWKAPLRSGSVPLTEIRAIYPYRWGPSSEVIALANGTRLHVMVQKGFLAFIQDLRAKAPAVPVDVNRLWARLGERFGGRGGYDSGNL